MKKSQALIVISIIVALLVLSLYLFAQKQEYKNDLIWQKSIPHINLKNTLSYNSNTGFWGGEIEGFVLFDDVEKQPKDMRQYYILTPAEPINTPDGDLVQLFTIDEVIAMNLLPPQSIGKTILNISNNSDKILTLEDEAGNLIFIDKITKEVSMKDATGETSKLITSNNEYGEIIRDSLRK